MRLKLRTIKNGLRGAPNKNPSNISELDDALDKGMVRGLEPEEHGHGQGNGKGTRTRRACA